MGKFRLKLKWTPRKLKKRLKRKKSKNGSSGSSIDKLIVWLDNTPFKSNAVSMKRDTFFAIISAVMELKAPDLENLCGSGGKLNDKLALTLSKYLFKAFDLIGKRDQQLISLVQNGQHLI